MDKGNYYLRNKKKMIREFEKMFKGASKSLEEYYTQEKINSIHKNCSEQYNLLLKELPFIGGDENKDTINLIMGAISISLIVPLEKEGLSQRQIGKVIYDSFEEYFNSTPKFIRKLIGKFATSNYNVKKMKQQVEKSSKREYEEDFVTEYVDNKDQEFDFGYNYVECGIHKMFVKKSLTEYLKFVCLGDFALFSALNIGFSRTQTIGNGACKCDFRFIKNGKTQSGWPPERLEEWNTSD